MASVMVRPPSGSSTSQRAGIHATLKHFLAYSRSRAGRTHAPVHAGPREVRDVFLPPFEMAIRDGGVRSVMNSYAEIDGVPVGSDPALLTTLPREELGFDGVVTADYFSVAFLETMPALGLLEAEAYEDEPPATVVLDGPRHRDTARRLAAESSVLARWVPPGGDRFPGWRRRERCAPRRRASRACAAATSARCCASCTTRARARVP